MPHRDGNHSAERERAAVAGEVGLGIELHRALRQHGLQRRLNGARKTAQQRRGGGVPRAEASIQTQLLQTKVVQRIAGGVEQGGQRVRLLHVQLRPLPRQVLFLAQHALLRAAPGKAPLKD